MKKIAVYCLALHSIKQYMLIVAQRKLKSEPLMFLSFEREVQNLLHTFAAEPWRLLPVPAAAAAAAAADACSFPSFAATCCAACKMQMHAAQQVATKGGKPQASAAVPYRQNLRSASSAAEVQKRFCTSLSIVWIVTNWDTKCMLSNPTKSRTAALLKTYNQFSLQPGT